MPVWGKTHRRRDILDGVASGFLLSGAFFTWILTPVIWIVPLATFIIGVIFTLDCIFPYGRQVFMYSWLSGLVAGTILIILSAIYELMMWLVLLGVLFFTFKLAGKLFRRLSS